MSTHRRLLLLAVLCFALKFNVAKVRVVKKAHSIASSDVDLFFDKKSFLMSDGFNFLTNLMCDTNTTEKHCEVYQLTDSSTLCSVNLKPTHFTYVSDYVDVLPLNATKVALVWAETDSFLRSKITPVEYYIKYTIVDLTTCESKHMELEGSRLCYYFQPFAHYTVYNNSFEIIYKDNYNEYTFYDKYVVDAEGNVASTDKNWVFVYVNKDLKFLPIVTNSTELKGHVVLHNGRTLPGPYDTPGHELLMVKTNGAKELLWESAEDEDVLNPIDVSTAHYAIGVAKANHSVIEVAQFDQDGNLKVKLNVTLEKEIDASVVGLYNLPTGGCLLAAGNHNSSTNETDLYHVFKVSEEGEVAGPVRIEPDPCYPNPPSVDCMSQSTSCNETLAIKVFENERNEYCLATMCSPDQAALYASRVEEHQFIEVVVTCFSDDDFLL